MSARTPSSKQPPVTASIVPLEQWRHEIAPIHPVWAARFDPLVARLRQQLGNEGYVRGWETGQTTPLDQAIAAARRNGLV